MFKSPLKPLHQAIQHMLIIGTIGLGQVIAIQAVQANTVEIQNYQIKAVTLDSALLQFASQAGVELSFDPQTIQHLKSNGLQGQYSVVEGFQTLLAPHGLQVQKTATGYKLIEKSKPQVRDMGRLNTIDVATTANSGHRAINDPDAVQLPVITVTAENESSYTVRNNTSTTKMDLSLRETPQTVTVFTRKLLNDQKITAIDDVLNSTPGVTMVSNSTEGNSIYVRGFDVNKSVSVNGISSGVASSSANMFNKSIDTALAESVEVIKGANGIVSGSGDPSASVNMNLKKPTYNTQSSFALTAGSWDKYRIEADLSGSLNQDKTIRGRTVLVYQDGNYFRDNYGIEKKIVYGVVEADLSPKAMLTFSTDYQTSDTTGTLDSTIPKYYTDGTLINVDRSFSIGQQWSSSNIDRYSLSPEFKYEFDNGWLAKATYRYTHAEADRTNFVVGTLVDKETGLLTSQWTKLPYASMTDREGKTHTAELFASGKFSLFDREHELVLGANYIQDTFESIGRRSDNLDPYYIYSKDISKPQMRSTASSITKDDMKQSGLYGTIRLNPMDRLKLMLGARISNWEHDTLSREPIKTKNEVIPYYGVIFDVNQFASLYASHTRIFQPQTLYGLDYQIVSPVVGSTTEYGLKFAFFDDQLNASISKYSTKKDKELIYDRWDADLGYSLYKIGDAIETDGYELEIAGQLTPNWNISAGYTNNTVENAAGHPRMTYVPSDTFKIFSTYQFDNQLTGLRIGGGLRLQNEIYQNDQSITMDGVNVVKVDVKQPAYSLIDIFAAYDINKTYNIELNVNNVLDKKYSRSVWLHSDYGEPRNLMLTLRAKY